MNINEFLLARIDEDEAAAKIYGGGVMYVYADGFVGIPDGEWEDGSAHLPNRHFDYAVMYDSGRVLAECAAKRALIAWVGRISERATKYPNDDAYVFAAGIVSRQLEYLAYAYKDHPDYQREWAVGVRVVH